MANVVLCVLLIHTLLRCNAVLGRPLDLPVKTIETAAGDIFDCVDIYKQPAFDHPLLKDHKILMKPNVIFKNSPEAPSDSDVPNDAVLADLELEGGGCPEGTVPVHRLPKTNSTNISTQWEPDYEGDPRTLIAVRRATHRSYYGASAMINTYAVDQIGEGQQSASMIWLSNIDAHIEQRGIIRAGWIVEPDKYSDTRTRMVIAFSNDGDQNICYNLECPGFVQVNHNVALGSTISPLSIFKRFQYYIYCHLFMDDKQNWWFALGDYSNVVGYWPADLFMFMERVTRIDFGGLVRCRQGQQCPPMGNGYAPRDVNGDGCYIRQSQVVGPDHKWGGMSFWKNYIRISQLACHDVGAYLHDKHGYKFSFGGGACNASF